MQLISYDESRPDGNVVLITHHRVARSHLGSFRIYEFRVCEFSVSENFIDEVGCAK